MPQTTAIVYRSMFLSSLLRRLIQCLSALVVSISDSVVHNSSELVLGRA